MDGQTNGHYQVHYFPHSPGIMAPQRGGGTSKSVQYLIFFLQLSYIMSPKQHIKTLVASVARNFSMAPTLSI